MIILGRLLMEKFFEILKIFLTFMCYYVLFIEL